MQKRFLPDREESYQQFLKSFQGYVDGRSDIEQMHNRIKELFKDEPDLVEGFEKFLPGTDHQEMVGE